MPVLFSGHEVVDPGCRDVELAAKALKLQLQYVDIRDIKDIEIAFRAAVTQWAGAALSLGGPVLYSHRTQVANLAVKNRLPVIFPQSEYVEDGGLMSYAPNYRELFRRAATYVDKILKGSKPSDLPVEQPMAFEFIVNLPAAKQIDLKIPPNVLARATRVIN